MYYLNLKTKIESTSETLWSYTKNYVGAQCINKYARIFNTYCSEDKDTDLGTITELLTNRHNSHIQQEKSSPYEINLISTSLNKLCSPQQPRR